MENRLNIWLAQKKAVIEEHLDRFLPSKTEPPERIHEAMRYCVFAGGKRIRPILVLGSCRVCSGNHEDSVISACAIECIHTYSLIHDDLPAMDNDDLRRGKPTCHKAFDDATAILAGDALLTFAFGLLATWPGEKSSILSKELAKAAGTKGMIGGQVLDIAEHPG
jgi:geranylgeranyl diphosphate synthase type II